MWYYTQAFRRSAYAPVAQLDRVTDYESVGRGFESLLAHQSFLILTKENPQDIKMWTFLSKYL